MRSKKVKYLLAEKVLISILPINLDYMSAINSLIKLFPDSFCFKASFIKNWVLPITFLLNGSSGFGVSKISKLSVLFMITPSSTCLNRSVVNSKAPKS